MRRRPTSDVIARVDTSRCGPVMDDDADVGAEADLDAAEILRIAAMLVNRHGPDALTVAQVSAWGALERDRFDEYLVWLDIRAAVAKLVACSMPNVRMH